MNKNYGIKDEVLRYLGYKNQKMDHTINKLIDESILEVGYISKKRYIYKFFDILRDGGELKLVNSNLKLPGNDIKDHLSKSKSCVLMAATLGHKVDTKIRYYEKKSMTKAMILDACATAFIEEGCNQLCREIESEIEGKNTLTSRYSPGYGDLPIEIQNKFLSVLDAKRTIGLNVTSHNILIPRKSVTAIAGIVGENEKINKKEKNNCINCNKYGACQISRGGNSCGY